LIRRDPHRRHTAAAVIWIKSPNSALSDEVLREPKSAHRNRQPIMAVEIAPVSSWDRWEDFAFL
jgi:hypothetical protein